MSGETEINGVTYRLATLNAMTQFHVSRRIMPLVAAIGGDGDAMSKVLQAVGQLSDEDSEYIIGKCLADCRRKNGDSWAKVYANGQLMFDDMTMATMVNLVIETLKDNLADFFTTLRSASRPPAN